MSDKTKFFLSLVLVITGILLGMSEGLWITKLGWFLTGIGIGGVLFIGDRNRHKLFSS